MATTTYESGSTPASVAQGLAVGAIPNSPVYVSSVDNALFIESAISGSSSNYPFLLQTTSWDQSDFPQPSFAYPAITGQLGGGSDASSNPHTVYNFHISYDNAGNVIGYTDSIGGTAHAWGFAYDSLNRLAGGSTNQAGNPTPNYCWSYDSFGNRLQQVSSSVAFGAQDGGASACPMQADSINNLAEYYNDNQVAVMNSRGTTSAPYIDDSGEMLTDGRNWYLYDAEGRVCASATTISGGLAMTGYIYNAEGNRVSKGSINSWSCDLSINGYSSLIDYVLGSAGETLSEVGYGLNAARTWQRTFVYTDNKLIATYDPNGLHYRLTDWLGSLRVASDYAGIAESTCTTLPFGEANSCSSPVDQHIFTGKERDTESGNDYFAARYYESSTGRFLSPDPLPWLKWQNSQEDSTGEGAERQEFVEQNSRGDSTEEGAERRKFNEWVENPQNLNMYAYVRNNPIINTDPSGLATLNLMNPKTDPGNVETSEWLESLRRLFGGWPWG